MTSLFQKVAVSIYNDINQFELIIKLGDEQDNQSDIFLHELQPFNKDFHITLETVGNESELQLGCIKGHLVISETGVDGKVIAIECFQGQKKLVDTKSNLFVSFMAKLENSDLPVMVCLKISRDGRAIKVHRHKDAQTAFS